MKLKAGNCSLPANNNRLVFSRGFFIFAELTRNKPLLTINNWQTNNITVPSSSVDFVDLEKVFPIKNKDHLKSLMPGFIRIYPLDTGRELKVHETFTLCEKCPCPCPFPSFELNTERYNQNKSEYKHFLCSVNLRPVSRG